MKVQFTDIYTDPARPQIGWQLKGRIGNDGDEFIVTVKPDGTTVNASSIMPPDRRRRSPSPEETAAVMEAFAAR